MSNQYFQFKKFKVQQDKCSMKVCTDSCLFGSWVAAELEQKKMYAQSILDIGAGTGLLSMMLAQKTTARIDAVEIDKYAFEQARQNVAESPWHEQIKLFHSNIKDFNSDFKYDLLISNPPFYENDLTAKDERRNISKHSTALGLEELIIISKKLLSDEGTLAVLLPWHRTKAFEDTASKHSFFIKNKMQVRQTTRHNYFRSMLMLKRIKSKTVETEILIKNKENEYSDEFKTLLKDYYLNL